MSYTLFTIISSLKIKRAAKLDLRKFAARLEIIIFFICKKVKRGLPGVCMTAAIRRVWAWFVELSYVRAVSGICVACSPRFRMSGRMYDWRTPARHRPAFCGALRRFSRGAAGHFAWSRPAFHTGLRIFCKELQCAFACDPDGAEWLPLLHESAGGRKPCTLPNCPEYSHIIARFLPFLYV